jgi:hypothetical protein
MKGLITIVVLSASSMLSAQSFTKPNHGLKYPETLVIEKIDITTAGTTIYITVENKVEGGTFCADPKIVVTDPTGRRVMLSKATGVPVCPDNYKFRGIGEKISFKLEFPPLPAGTKWIDLVEECDNYCFWIYGITLDNELNRKLDEAFISASENSAATNVTLFRNILEPIDNENLGIEGMLYLNIIIAAVEDADRAGVSVWYKRLAGSNAPRVGSYIKYLNDRGIK